MQRFIRLATVLVGLLSAFGSLAQEIEFAKIKPMLVQASDELEKASLRTEITQEQYESVMDISCNVLYELSKDDNFALLLQEYESRQYDETLENEIRELFLSFRGFLVFMIIERDLLLDAGFSEAATDEILAQLFTVRSEAAAFRLDAAALLMNLQAFAEQTCSASTQIAAHVERAEMICNIKRLAPFVLGAAATVVDGLSFLVPLGITQAVSGASIAGGAVLMSGAGLMSQC